jgi:hypothetical protein
MGTHARGLSVLRVGAGAAKKRYGPVDPGGDKDPADSGGGWSPGQLR